MSVTSLKHSTSVENRSLELAHQEELMEKLCKTRDLAQHQPSDDIELTKKTELTTELVLPRNDLESKLSTIWQEVLSTSDISIHSDFFALGGSSLLAVFIVARIRGELDLELPVRDFFANPTIATQATHISSLLKKPDDNHEAVDVNKQLDASNQNSIALRKRLPKIEPSYFNDAEERLFGMHYRPQQDQQTQSHAILICHPLGHEYSRAYRNLQQFSLNLSKAGFNVFRFDYVGTGNSSGNSGDPLTSDYINNIKVAAEHLRQQSNCEKLSIVALRMGAPLAVSANINNLENLILWDPVVKGSHYINLLQGFQDKMLSMLERFRVKRRPSNAQQLYGYAMSDQQRESLVNLELPCLRALIKSENRPNKLVMVTSSAYQRNEPSRLDLLNHCQHFATKDEIHWHDRLYADSAFSSPQAFKSMMSVLIGEQL